MKRIVIIGPESTGKSTLTQQLARHFNATGIDEYARTYLRDIDRRYVQQDLLAIGKGQTALEDAVAKNTNSKWLFCDTDLYVLKVWSESKYGTCDEWILQEIAQRKYDLYILTDIDMPWEDDPLREHPEPEMRQHFFDIYKDIVIQSGVPFVIVQGNEQERLKRAIQAILMLEIDM
ncbi:AAA family ATPase [Taibaiella lutea]|uniref:AAA family ATPase n=1 Tax=Taibaiella lutea TaxID=2608001 RepID=UPI001C1093CA|nr:ATP-binding protein [Taibaiella lutea]